MSKRETETMGHQDAVLEELRAIHQLLASVPPYAMPPAAPKPKPKGLLNEFKFFLNEYKVMGLAVAFILGLYLGGLVKSLVDNLVMPIVQIFTPGLNWESIAFGPFRVGAFMGDLITFIVIAFVIFILIKITTRMGIK